MIRNVQNNTTQWLSNSIMSSQKVTENLTTDTKNIVNTPEEVTDKKEPIMHKGMDVSKFNPEDIERWDQMIENYDPMFISFCIVATESLNNCKPGTVSMSFYDFCSTIESGKVISEQNVIDGKAVYAERKDNLEYVIMNSIDQYGEVNKNENKQILNIIKSCYDLGMMTKEHGLLLPAELNAIRLKQKYSEQQVFQSKQYANHLEEKQETIQKLYKTQLVQGSYQNSI